METTIQSRAMTEEDLMSLPGDCNYEYVNGKVIEMSPAGIEHDYIVARLVIALGAYVLAKDLGIVCGSSAGYWMKSGNSRSPDISFIAKSRLRGLKRPPKKFFQGAPDLAVEVLSPSDTFDSIHNRVVEYFESGASLVWVINAEEQTVLVYHSAQPDRILKAGDLLDGEQVVPGFSFPVAELFSDFDFA